MVIETVNGSRYVWQKFPGLRTRGITTYCADGDGFVEVRELNGKFGLYDQGTRVRTFHAENVSDALRLAEYFADSAYPTMLEAYLIDPASDEITALKGNLDAQGLKHFGELPKGWDGASKDLLRAMDEGESTQGMLLAVIGREHFRNPIPQAWYSAAREFLSSCNIEDEVDRPRGMQP